MQRLDAARIIRMGAERLRQIAADDTNQELARQMRQMAAEMDENAAHLERSVADIA